MRAMKIAVLGSGGVGGYFGGRLAATGAEDVRRALSFGQVDELLIDDTAELAEGERAALVREAVAIDANVETVEGDSALLSLGGVAALLRYELPAG
jgi:stalled ribosome rescue protein Dom34